MPWEGGGRRSPSFPNSLARCNLRSEGTKSLRGLLARSLARSFVPRAARRPRQSTSSYSPRLEATAEGRAGFRAPRRGFTQPSGLSFAEPCVFGKRLEARPSRPALRKIHRFIPNNKGGGAATELSRMVVAHYHTWVSPKPKGQEVMRGGTVQVDRNRKQWQGLPLFSCIITASQEGKQKEADRGTCVSVCVWGGGGVTYRETCDISADLTVSWRVQESSSSSSCQPTLLLLLPFAPSRPSLSSSLRPT